VEILNKLEALLFLTPKPLTLQEISKLLESSPQEITKALQELKKRYEGTALQVEEFLNSYRLNVRDEYRDLARKLGLLPEFSKGELKILAELLRKGELRLSWIKKRHRRRRST